jgi:hypothetical protein
MGWGMKQLTLATAVFDRYAKTTRRSVFLAEMERVVPWSALCKLIEPFYPKPVCYALLRWLRLVRQGKHVGTRRVRA